MKQACYFALALSLAGCSHDPDQNLESKLFYFQFERIEIADKAVISALAAEEVAGRKAILHLDIMRGNLRLIRAIDTSAKGTVVSVVDGSPPFKISLHPQGKGEMSALVKVNRAKAIRLLGTLIDGEGRERELINVPIPDVVVPNESTEIAQGAIKVVFRMND